MMSLFTYTEGSENKFEGLGVDVKVLKQKRKGFLAQLTKAINRAEQYLQQENPVIQEVANINEKIEFSLFKLKTNMTQICSVGTKEDCEHAQHLFLENSERCKVIFKKCENFLSKLDDDTRSQVSERAFDGLNGNILNKVDALNAQGSSKSSISNNSQKQQLSAAQLENRAKRDLDLLKQRQNLEIAEANEKYLRAKEDREISEKSFSISDPKLKYISTKILPSPPKDVYKKPFPRRNFNSISKNRQSYQYFSQPNEILDQQNKIYNEIPLENKHELGTSQTRPPTPFAKKVQSYEDFVSIEPIDAFIEKLVEGQETVLPESLETTSAFSVLQRDFETRLLPPVELTRFKDNPSNWPNFIQCFKEQVHDKKSFTDNFRMSMLLSLLDGEAKQIVLSIGSNGIFYASCLKALKQEFGNPYVVAHLKLREILDRPQISIDDYKGLRKFHQHLEGAITWLCSMGYISSLKATENVSRAVMRLPKPLRISFYKKFTSKQFDEESMNLLKFEKWLKQKVQETCNPIANIIENSLKRQNQHGKHLHPSRTNAHSSDRYLKNGEKYQKGGKPNFKLICCLCEGEHKVSYCSKLKSLPVEERLSLIKQHKLCFNCLSNDHMIDKCQSKFTCREEGCGKRHHTLLHRPRRKLTPNDEGVKETEKNVHTQFSSTNKISLLKIIPVILKGDNTEIKTNALLDTGSDVSLISTKIASKLNLKGEPLNLNISSVLTKSSNVPCTSVNLNITSVSQKYEKGNVEAYVVKDLNVNPRSYNIQEVKEKYPYLKDIYFPLLHDSEIEILIGTNNADLLLHTDFRKGSPNEPIAVKTCLGWVLIGNCSLGENDTKGSCNHILLNNCDTQMSKTVEQFWDIESYSTKKTSNIDILPPLEKKAIEILKAETTLKDNHHFETPLLWKHNEIHLYNNRNLAMKRFTSLEKKFSRNSEFAKMYQNEINTYIKEGYARKLTAKEALTVSNKTNYLPHHGVIHPHKPGKVRVVFDASARFQNSSLNSNLLPGPDLLNNLISVLIKFRQGKYAVMADIKAMFHQVFVKPPDTDSLRFVWRDKPQDPISEYIMLVHVFGKVDSPCCVNWSLREVPKYSDQSLVDVVTKNFYMDDLLKSLSSEEALINLSFSLIKALSSCGFQLTKWVSNSDTILKALPTSELSPKIINLDRSSQPIERALGLMWDLVDDTFVFKPILKTYTKTKRGILSLVATIFDPLGILTPCMLEAKLIIQELWKKGIDWDEDLPNYLNIRWMKWFDQLVDINKVKLPRWIGFHEYENYKTELIIFCDASKLAYGAVSYIKLTNLDTQHIDCSFLLAKSRLAPLKEKSLTIPRLELQAAVLAVRLKDTLINQLDINIDEYFIYSDSQIVLNCIKNIEKDFKPFVMHRLNEIRSNSLIKQWRYIPGSENVADMCTRTNVFKNLTPTSIWIKGPKFVYELERREYEIERSDYIINTLQTVENKNDAKTHTSCINWNIYSEYYKLVRHVSWIIKLKTNYLNNKRNNTETNTLQLTTNDIEIGKCEIFKECQKESFQKEIDDLSNEKSLSNSNLIPLSPFLEDGLIRVGGRIGECLLPYSQKHQIVISNKHHLAFLLIRYIHVKNNHCGRELTLSLLREQFWIIKCKGLIRKILNNCSFCKRFKTKPKQPYMSSLPLERISFFCPPFFYTGVDYFGPMLIKLNKRTRANSGTAKRYGALFTCMSTRAIHLELAGDLSTDSFILALRRFISRRGHPKQIRSDNGTNFVGAQRELKDALKALNQDKITKTLNESSICWKFNPPSSPWMGGAMEALVKLTKKSLKIALNEKRVTEETLSTLLTEVESILNNRPLTTSSDDVNDLQPLTPNHILIGRSSQNNQFVNVSEKDVNCRVRWRAVQAMSTMFWNRWIKEYLPLLTVRRKWTKNIRNFKVGDLILVADNQNVERSKWPLGRVIEVFPSKDNVVRTVKIKTSNSELLRPVAKLCLLEESE